MSVDDFFKGGFEIFDKGVLMENGKIVVFGKWKCGEVNVCEEIFD